MKEELELECVYFIGKEKFYVIEILFAIAFMAERYYFNFRFAFSISFPSGNVIHLYQKFVYTFYFVRLVTIGLLL